MMAGRKSQKQSHAVVMMDMEGGANVLYKIHVMVQNPQQPQGYESLT